MAKTSTVKAAKGQSEPQVQQDKEQKKQAKQEAKLKVKIELMPKSLQKAERKATKASADVDTLRAQLYELNEQLAHNGASSDHQEGEHEATEVEQVSINTEPASGDEPHEDEEAIEELHLASPPPVEGRSDLEPFAEQQQSSDAKEESTTNP